MSIESIGDRTLCVKLLVREEIDEIACYLDERKASFLIYTILANCQFLWHPLLFL